MCYLENERLQVNTDCYFKFMCNMKVSIIKTDFCSYFGIGKGSSGPKKLNLTRPLAVGTRLRDD